MYMEVMRKLIVALLACLPLAGAAQSTWEIPREEQQQPPISGKKNTPSHNKKKAEDAKYLAGAVTEADGRVVFRLDKAVPGMPADTIYSRVYAAVRRLTQEENRLPGSKIALVNPTAHSLVATMREWLVFNSSFLSLDRTKFFYTLIAQATDGHLLLTLTRISYQYDHGRSDARGGLDVKAEDWITDKHALNKHQDKLRKYSAKFRRKTIDRKDEIFEQVCRALAIDPGQDATR